MRVIDNKWECWAIVHNDRYVATLGNGITVWDRSTLTFLHHFTGVKWIHGGVFINDDVLLVYTGEQKLFFFQVPKKELLWAVPRPRVLDSSGDIRCCNIPGTEKVACIARGRKAMDDHYLLIVDSSSRELSIQQIPNCYRVISNFVWTSEFGLTFLSKQAKGDNNSMLYSIHQISQDGNVKILFDEESTLSVLTYSGNYLFMADYSCQIPEASVFPIELSASETGISLGIPLKLLIPPQPVKGPVGTKRLILPQICWVDETSGLMVVCNKQKNVSIYDFLNAKKLAEHRDDDVIYGKLLDGRLLIGCSSGFSVETLT